jgi:hypothetical protein
MPKKKEVNFQKLIERIEDGAEEPTLLQEFEFKTSAQLKSAYFDALVKLKNVPPISQAKIVTIKKRGSITINKQLVQEFGFKEGDSFEIKKDGYNIFLKCINNDEENIVDTK